MIWYIHRYTRLHVTTGFHVYTYTRIHGVNVYVCVYMYATIRVYVYTCIFTRNEWRFHASHLHIWKRPAYTKEAHKRDHHTLKSRTKDTCSYVWGDPCTWRKLGRVTAKKREQESRRAGGEEREGATGGRRCVCVWKRECVCKREPDQRRRWGRSQTLFFISSRFFWDVFLGEKEIYQRRRWGRPQSCCCSQWPASLRGCRCKFSKVRLRLNSSVSSR